MAPNICPVMRSFVLLFFSLLVSHAQLPPSTNVHLRLEPRTNALDLMVDGSAGSGAFFIYQAHDPQSLRDGPAVAVQTNTPLTNGLRFSIPMPGALPSQMFFTAAHWPGRAVEEFGEPENYPDIPPPEMVLFTSGAPVPLTSGQIFTVDFFITDPAGQMLDVSGPAAILIFRESDGALHPDATVSPSAGQLTNGHLSLQVTVQSIAPLNGYVLGLGPDPGGLAALTKGLLFLAASGLNQPLKPTANVAPPTLEQLRISNADAGPSWSYPLAGSGHPVSGTFGEWRGLNNKDVHRGVDLAAVAASTAVAARGGVVSHRGTLAGMGDCLVVDHGGGWFSRYLHLDPAYISVAVGQAVARGAALATRLYAVGAWPQHLHFEIRHGANQAQWNFGSPGVGQDPLQDPSIFPVAAGTQSPRLEEFGLTRQHPGQNAFVKAAPTANAPGPIYLFAKLLDLGGTPRLGLRAMSFQPEGLAVPVEIRPADDTAITALLPSAAGAEKGFARYSGAHAATPDRLNHFRYWWRWDTSAYNSTDERKGPRAILLTGTDHNPVTAEFHFTFGPQVKPGTLTPLSALQYQFTQVAHLGTNTPVALGNAALFVQPDQYKLEIIRPNGQPLGGVTWSPPLVGGTRVFTAHLEEEVHTFTLPAGATAEALKLRVSSRLAPDIAHELCLCGVAGMAFIPGGAFAMGSDEYPTWYGEQPIHTVSVSGFCMDKYEVTKTLWDEVYQWAITHGYTFDYANSGQGKAANHPAHSMTWYDVVKWCNARSEKEGRVPAYYTSAAQTAVYRSGQVGVQNDWVKWNAGYRLPTEAEWEKAARGGSSGHRFPWSNVETITHGQANYYSFASYAYDISPTRNYHPSFQGGGTPYTSPAGYFAPNGYGLYDMAGNVWEWCWDWYGSYGGAAQTDPRGPATGSYRVIRGGSWNDYAIVCRSAHRNIFVNPDFRDHYVGFRVVLAPGQ